MISEEYRLKFVLEELYRKVCNCRRDYEELEDLLNPIFHLDDCPYRILVEKENIQWNEPTQES